MRSITSTLFTLVAIIAMLSPTMNAAAGGPGFEAQSMDTVQRAVRTLEQAQQDLDAIEDDNRYVAERIAALEGQLEGGANPTDIIAAAKRASRYLSSSVDDLDNVRSTVELTRKELLKVQDQSLGSRSVKLKRLISDAFTMLKGTEARADKVDQKLKRTQTTIMDLIEKARGYLG